MRRDDFPAPREGMVLTHFLTVEDVDRSRAFYADVLGGQVLIDRSPCIIKLANAWVILNVGGGPTEDKPDVTLLPPTDLKKASCVMNIRVADIKAKYDEWRSKGAIFLTPPIDRGAEIRCYMRDPDGYLIEVGEATGILKTLEEEKDR